MRREYITAPKAFATALDRNYAEEDDRVSGFRVVARPAIPSIINSKQMLKHTLKNKN